jgi:glycosyltransferase involved in cell wall biosynthesis
VNISVVIPAKNEQGNVRPLIDEIVTAIPTNIDYEIIYVDDGSTDGTGAELQAAMRELNIDLRALRHQESVGQSTAILTGVRHAKYHWIVTLDADGQNDPADIPKFLALAATQDVDSHFCIAGYRHKRKDTPWKRFQSRIANKVRNSMLHDETPDTGCGLKLIPRHTYLRLPYFDHMHRFLPALVKRAGGKVMVVKVNHRDRQQGTSNYTMLSRLGVGIVDIFGVMWLSRRAYNPSCEELHSE